MAVCIILSMMHGYTNIKFWLDSYVAEKGYLGVYWDILGRNDCKLEEVRADEYHNFIDTSPNTVDAFRSGYIPKETHKPKTDVCEVKRFWENWG